MAVVAEDDPRLLWHSIEELSKLPEGSGGRFDILRDHWWIVGTKGLAFWSFNKTEREAKPQANRNKEVAERVQKALYPWATLEKISVVYIPVRY